MVRSGLVGKDARPQSQALVLKAARWAILRVQPAGK
jgi:hypothetical protein